MGWQRYFTLGNQYFKKIRKRYDYIEKYIVGPKIIDIGCGPGVGCYLAAKKEDVTEVCGLDLQEDMIKQAKENIKNKKVSFYNGFAENLPFKDKYFDTVILTETLEHVQDEREVIKEAFRVLKPDQIIIISVPISMKKSFSHIRTFTKEILINLVKPYFLIDNIQIIKTTIFLIGKRKI
jgi:2-polyprenyl-6-hydroxyphenyl methylase/3-demethylubiquinone-9 3-methyltransferase